MSNWKLKQLVSDSRVPVSVLSYLVQLKSQLEICSLRCDNADQVQTMASNLLHEHEPKDRRARLGYMLFLKADGSKFSIEKHLRNRTIVVAEIHQAE